MFTRSYYSYFKIGRLSYHNTKISTGGFYNAMQLREISTRPNWNFDRKSWRYKRNYRLFSISPWLHLALIPITL